MAFYNLPKLDILTEKVIELLPPQRPFFESDYTIEEYSKMLFDYEADEVYRERQKSLLKLVQEKISRLFTKEERLKINLPDYSTGLKAGLVYHQGILNHPVIIGVDIVANFFRMFNRDENGDILTFATGNIPLNNFFYRRGFNIGGVHVNLYPKKNKNKIVYQHPLFKFDIVGSLKETHQWKEHSEESQKFLEQIQEIINQIDFSNCKTMGDQITKINFHLYPLMFDKNLRKKVSNWICLEYDDILSDFLIDIFQNHPESFIYQLLFNTDLNQKTLKHFEGKTNAWNEERQMGTHFFWGIVDGETQRLLLQGGKLKSEDGSLQIGWNKESIIEALKKRQIFPGMFMKYSLLVLYAGMKPFAGYASSNSIAQMQHDLSEFLANDFPEDCKLMKQLVVNNLTSIPVLLKRTPEGTIENYWAFDIMKDGGLSEQYFQKLNSVPIKYFMVPNLPTMYDYGFNLYGKGEKADPKIDPIETDKLMSGIIS